MVRIMDYEKKYKEALKLARVAAFNGHQSLMEGIFPELAESEDEKTRKRIIALVNAHGQGMYKDDMLAWLEKQGSEPNWCHHKVDLSGCSEEYRKAYYDGWNNCNQQHSQCKSERNDVVKCLINGMKFYYEDNEEATWGTEKFSMRVKDILSWLEKQGEQASAWSEEDREKIDETLYFIREYQQSNRCKDENGMQNSVTCKKWLKSLKERIGGRL